jgi:hypothetical protein
VCDEFHGGRDRLPTDVRRGNATNIQVADVAVEPLGSSDTVVAEPLTLLPRCQFLLRGHGVAHLVGSAPQSEVLVSANREELFGHPGAQRLLVQVVVLPGGQPRLDRDRRFFGLVRENVLVAEDRERVLDQLPWRHVYLGVHRQSSSRASLRVRHQARAPSPRYAGQQRKRRLASSHGVSCLVHVSNQSVSRRPELSYGLIRILIGSHLGPTRRRSSFLGDLF